MKTGTRAKDGLMVTEMKDYTGKWFEVMADGFKTMMETSRATQESMFKAAGGWVPENMEQFPVEDMRQRGEKMVKTWQPMMKRNLDTTMALVDSNYKSGIDLAKASFDAMHDLNRENVEDRTRRVWDASFNAIRTNFNAISNASKTASETFMDFCHSATPKAEPKPADKASK